MRPSSGHSPANTPAGRCAGRHALSARQKACRDDGPARTAAAQSGAATGADERRAVCHILVAQRRQPAGVATFASFASLWLLPRLQEFQHAHAASGIRISAAVQLSDFDDREVGQALRYGHPDQAPRGAVEWFSARAGNARWGVPELHLPVQAGRAGRGCASGWCRRPLKTGCWPSPRRRARRCARPGDIQNPTRPNIP